MFSQQSHDPLEKYYSFKQSTFHKPIIVLINEIGIHTGRHSFVTRCLLLSIVQSSIRGQAALFFDGFASPIINKIARFKNSVDFLKEFC